MNKENTPTTQLYIRTLPFYPTEKQWEEMDCKGKCQCTHGSTRHTTTYDSNGLRPCRMSNCFCTHYTNYKDYIAENLGDTHTNTLKLCKRYNLEISQLKAIWLKAQKSTCTKFKHNLSMRVTWSRRAYKGTVSFIEIIGTVRDNHQTQGYEAESQETVTAYVFIPNTISYWHHAVCFRCKDTLRLRSPSYELDIEEIRQAHKSHECGIENIIRVSGDHGSPKTTETF